MKYYTIDPWGAIESCADACFVFDDETGGCACLETDREIVTAWNGRLYFRGEEPPRPAPTLEEQTQQFMAVIQARLDDFARTRGYDGVLSASSYATSNNATYRAEGQYMVDARDTTWAWANDYLNQVLAGQKLAPSLEEFMAELDAAVPLVWPVPDTRVTVNA